MTNESNSETKNEFHATCERMWKLEDLLHASLAESKAQVEPPACSWDTCPAAWMKRRNWRAGESRRRNDRARYRREIKHCKEDLNAISKARADQPLERVWGNYKLRTRYSTGYAAHSNRGAYSGTKVHQIAVEEIVELIDPAAEQKGTIGYRFILNGGKPVQFSAHPLCGCTQGQNAARESANLTVTCVKCGGAQ
jgi:hypothetical protein